MYDPNYDLEDLVNFQTTVKTTRFNQDEDMLDNPPEDFFMPNIDELPQSQQSSTFNSQVSQQSRPVQQQTQPLEKSAAAMVNEMLGGMTAEEANEELQNLTPYNTEESNEKNDTNLCTADMVSPQMKAQMTKLLRR